MKQNNDRYRPAFHYTPRKGYMNDPNGLVYNRRSRQYHMFYQYSDTIYSEDEWFGSWVEKNWGHAVSEDLLHWRELDVALRPDELGLVWSGSTVVDRKNALGVFPPDSHPEDRLVAAYAAAGIKPHPVYGKIKCCLAYSPDGGFHWKKFAGNPVVGNENNHYEEAFGDPKLFWYEDAALPGGGIWVMITVYRVRIFTSPDLKNWTLNDEPLLEGQPFCSECPDFFPAVIAGEKKWVFSGAGKYYIVGRFGHDAQGRFSFEPESPKLEAKFGNLYATQHFANLPDDRIVNVSWMGDHSSLDLWRQGKCWDGVQSLPMELRFEKRAENYALLCCPAREVDALREKVILHAENEVVSGYFRPFSRLRLQTFELDMTLDVSNCSAFWLRFRKRGREETLLSFDAANRELILNTYNSGKVVHEYHHLPVKLQDDKLSVRLLVDTTALDLFVDRGEVSRSLLFFPNPDSDRVELRTEGELLVERLDLYALRHIF